MDANALSKIALIVSIFSALFTGVGVWLLWREYRITHEWNRRKASQDIIVGLYAGPLVSWIDELHDVIDPLGRELWRKGDYADAISALNPTDQESMTRLDNALWKILDMLTTFSVQIRANILDSEICYHQMGHILTNYYRWALPYIQKRRQESGEDRLYYHLEALANEWSDRTAEFRTRSLGLFRLRKPLL